MRTNAAGECLRLRLHSWQRQHCVSDGSNLSDSAAEWMGAAQTSGHNLLLMREYVVPIGIPCERRLLSRGAKSRLIGLSMIAVSRKTAATRDVIQTVGSKCHSTLVRLVLADTFTLLSVMPSVETDIDWSKRVPNS